VPELPIVYGPTDPGLSVPADTGGAAYFSPIVFPVAADKVVVVVRAYAGTAHHVGMTLLQIAPNGTPTVLDAVLAMSGYQTTTPAAFGLTHTNDGLLWAFSTFTPSSGMQVQGIRVGPSSLAVLPIIHEGAEPYASGGFTDRPLIVAPSGTCISLGAQEDIGAGPAVYRKITYDLDAGTFTNVAGPTVESLFLPAPGSGTFQGLNRAGCNLSDTEGIFFLIHVKPAPLIPDYIYSLDMWHVDFSFNFTSGVHIGPSPFLARPNVVPVNHQSMVWQQSTESLWHLERVGHASMVWPPGTFTQPIPSLDGAMTQDVSLVDFSAMLQEYSLPALTSTGPSYHTANGGINGGAWLAGNRQYIAAGVGPAAFIVWEAPAPVNILVPSSQAQRIAISEDTRTIVLAPQQGPALVAPSGPPT
jgi:hypothetical protein